MNRLNLPVRETAAFIVCLCTAVMVHGQPTALAMVCLRASDQ